VRLDLKDLKDEVEQVLKVKLDRLDLKVKLVLKVILGFKETLEFKAGQDLKD
jgi:hypothetical protein